MYIINKLYALNGNFRILWATAAIHNCRIQPSPGQSPLHHLPPPTTSSLIPPSSLLRLLFFLYSSFLKIPGVRKAAAVGSIPAQIIPVWSSGVIMAPPRRQSTSKALPSGISTPSTISTLVPNRPLSSQPTTKLKIHPLLEVYEAAISALMATLAEDPYRSENTAEAVKRVLAYEQELDEALDESTPRIPEQATLPFVLGYVGR